MTNKFSWPHRLLNHQATFAVLLMLVTFNGAYAQTARFGIWGATDILDPIYATTTEHTLLAAHAFECLVVLSPDGEPIGAQAVKWDISEDGRTYTFYLRDGITWSDGTPVVAEDFVAGFQRLVDPNLTRNAKPTYLVKPIVNVPAILAGELPPSEIGVRAIDDRTLEIRLANPAGYFLSVLAYPGLVPAPRHKIRKHGEAWSEQLPLVSNGQLTITQRSEKEYILERRDDHWEPLSLDKLVIKVYSNNTEVFQGLILGDLDIALGIPSKQANYTKRGFSGRVEQLAVLGVIYGVFNTLDPKLSSPNVRRALAMLVDRNEIVTRLGVDKKFAGKTFSPPQFLKPSPANTPVWTTWPMSKRIEVARQLLMDEKYSDESPLELSIMTTNYHDFDKVAIAIRSMWAQAPVRTTIVEVISRELSRRLRANEYQFSVAAWYGDYNDPLTFLGLLEKNGTKNHSDWSIPEYEILLASALKEPELSKRIPLYNKMEMILGQEAPLFPILYPALPVGVSKRVKSYSLSAYQIVARDIVIEDD